MSLVRAAIEREFNPRKVEIVEFSESDEFCGKALYPRQRVALKLFFLEEMDGYEEDVLDEWIRGYGGVEISPFIRERRDWLREHGYRHFPEVILVGGRRSSKGYITALAFAKLIYDVQQLGDPGAYYGIDAQKEIYFSAVAASLEQAKQYQFADLVSTITQCKALIDNAKVQEEGVFIKTPSDDRLVADLKARGVKVGRDYCLSSVTPMYVRTDRGDRPMLLSEMVTGCKPGAVEVWNGLFWSKVVAWQKSTQTSGLAIELRDGQILHATSNHRWPTDRGLVSTVDLAPGDVLQTTDLPEPDDVVDAVALDDHDIGWLVGLYIAEGSGVGKRGRFSIASHADDLARVERLTALAADFHGTVSSRKQSDNGMEITVYSKMLEAVIADYVAGTDAHTKHLCTKAWQRSNRFLMGVLIGYLEGDGSPIKDCTSQWHLGFCRNRKWEANLRSLCARLGGSVRLRPFDNNGFPGLRGTLSLPPGKRITDDTEVVSVSVSPASSFWDIEVADKPHLFALASGLLSHNSKLRVKPLAANADTIRGSTTYAVVFDEMAFMLPGESRSSSEQCYQAARPALAQFGRDAMVFLNSSPYTKVGTFFERYELSNEVAGNAPRFPEMMSFRFPSWELYRDYDKDAKGRFNRVGAIMVDPATPEHLLTDNDKAKKRQAILEETANPEAFKVERRAMWAEVIDAYLNPASVDHAFESFYMGRPIKMTAAGTYNYTYKGHCDPSSTTAGFGFAIAHVEEFPDEINPDVNVKHVVFDLVKRWNPQDFPGKTIDYMKVVEEIAHYMTLFQPMYEMTFDQFNSVAPIQWLRGAASRRRLRTQVFTVHATKANNWDRYEVLKTSLNLGLVHIPNNCPDAEYSMLELKFLQEENSKVIKQDLGPVTTKDIADCICEVTYSLIGTQIHQIMGDFNQTMALGAQGGWQIGGRNPEGPMNFEDFYKRKRPGGFLPGRGIDPRRRRR